MPDETIVPMPRLGEASDEATLVRWLRDPGSRVEAGDPIAEVVTDKVSDDVKAPVAGVLGARLVSAGQVVTVGTPLVAISSAHLDPAPLSRGAEEVSARAGGAPSERPDLASSSHGGKRTGEVGPRDVGGFAAPLVRRLAERHGIDLATVAGTGPGGRVTKDDIEAAIAALAPPSPEAGVGETTTATSVAMASGGGLSAMDGGPEEEVQPASPLRQAIAANLVQAVSGVPQAWTLVEVDASALLAWRDAHREAVQARTGVALTTFALVVHALSRVVVAHPAINGAWRDGPGGIAARGDAGGRVVRRRRVHAGIPVARPGGGLLVPVIRDADRLDLDATAVALDRAANGARGGTLPADAYAGATVTLNNTGALGSVASRPILPAGTAAIVAFEAIVRRPVVVAGDAIAIRPVANLCLTFDHRVMDGLEACAFLQGAKRALEAFGA